MADLSLAVAGSHKYPKDLLMYLQPFFWDEGHYVGCFGGPGILLRLSWKTCGDLFGISWKNLQLCCWFKGRESALLCKGLKKVVWATANTTAGNTTTLWADKGLLHRDHIMAILELLYGIHGP